MARMRNSRKSTYGIGGARGRQFDAGGNSSSRTAISSAPSSSSVPIKAVNMQPLSATSPQQIAALPRLDRAPIIRHSSAGMGGQPIMGKGERYPGAGRYQFYGGNAYQITN